MSVVDSMGVPKKSTTDALSGAADMIKKMLPDVTKMANEFTRAQKAANGMPGAGGGGGFSVGNLTTSGTFTNIGGNSMQGMGTMGGFLGMTKAAGQFGLDVAGAAMGMMPSIQDAVTTQLSLSQAKFYGYQGGAAGVRSAMNQGTMPSPDAMMQAMAIGTANGMLPGGPGYNGLMNGIGRLSNITGSPQSAMNAAVSLNQAETVNTLRMYGISVRNATGGMRSPEAIYKDIKGLAERTMGTKLTPDAIRRGMQPGGGLRSFVETITQGDPDAFMAIQGSLMQFAQGGDLSRGSTTKTGMTTAASNAASNKNASEFGLTAAAADPMAAGYAGATNALAKVNDKLASLISQNGMVADSLKLAAGAQTMMASSLGTAAAGILSAVRTFVGTVAAGRGGIPGGGVGTPMGKGGMPIAAKAGLVAVGAQGVNMAYQSTLGKHASQSTRDKVGAGANILSAAGTGAMIGSFLGPEGTAAGALIGGLIGGGMALAQNWDTLFGGGGNGYGADPDSSSGGQPNVQAGLGAVSVAATQIGIPYSWGGGSIQGPTKGINQGSDTVGFDCSSLVVFVMARLGISMPRTAHEQQKVGQQIDPKDAQPGDLLFWGNPAHHVAIYAGSGMMIHAPRTGKNVERKGVNLEGVTSACRVINAKTGAADMGNLLGGNGNPLSGGSSAGGYGGFPGAIASALTPEALRGVSADAAMGSPSAGGSGLGLGAEGPENRSSAIAMASIKSSMVLNSKTGTLEHSSAGGAVINYGGVTIPITVKDAVSAKEVGKIVKDELTKLSINAKVVSS